MKDTYRRLTVTSPTHTHYRGAYGPPDTVYVLSCDCPCGVNLTHDYTRSRENRKNLQLFLSFESPTKTCDSFFVTESKDVTLQLSKPLTNKPFNVDFPSGPGSFRDHWILSSNLSKTWGFITLDRFPFERLNWILKEIVRWAIRLPNRVPLPCL